MGFVPSQHSISGGWGEVDLDRLDAILNLTEKSVRIGTEGTVAIQEARLASKRLKSAKRKKRRKQAPAEPQPPPPPPPPAPLPPPPPSVPVWLVPVLLGSIVLGGGAYIYAQSKKKGKQ